MYKEKVTDVGPLIQILELKAKLNKTEYLKICLLLNMAGHVSSANAPERTSSSNNFLHVVRR